MVINMAVKNLKRDMDDAMYIIENEGYTLEASDMCLEILDRMTGYLCEDIPDELASFVFDNMDSWRDITKLAMAVAHVDDPDFKLSNYFAEVEEY